jgi:hypothetical protein
MTQIGNHDDTYLSTPLEEKLAWFQNAPGLSVVEPARQFMAGAAALYTDSDSQIRATMRNLGADWTGDAATNAGAGLQRAADWSQGAGAGHSAAGRTVEGYGQSFESLRGQVHWDDPWAWGWRDTATAAASVASLDPGVFLGNLTTDYFATAQQNRTNDASAVAALRAHEQQTRAAVDSFPALAPASIDPSSATQDGPHPGGGSVTAGAAAAVATQPIDRAGGGRNPGSASTASPPGSAVPVALGAAGLGGPGSTTATPPGGPGGGGSAARSGAPGGLGPPSSSGGLTGQGGSSGAIPDGPGGLGPPSSSGGRTGERPSRGALPGEPGSGLRPGPPAGRSVGAPLGGGASEGGGGWRELVPRGPSEPGTVPRNPGSGGEFAGRLPSGSSEATPPIAGRGAAAGGGMPYLGGMGAGAAARPTEHRHAYWVRSSEPFDVPLPPHGDGLLQGSEG